ncbi:MAG: symmetrical bis(5'-nucleosyl)-tetraphosphatase [Myxococcales bacterium]|nr:symmetrical bis(5'-nucleosyl)-tetraphosphatase [Myxococcales bacterium]
MSEIYAIGDVQGCFESLQALLKQLPLQDEDRIWLCGDLVNRGPMSAEVLRWAMAQGERLRVVLGNHDLHLLSAAAGKRKAKARDTFQDVLDADDREELLGWLVRQPLAVREGEYLMVHAGLHPSWMAEPVLSIAKQCEDALQSGMWHAAWKRSRPIPPVWCESLEDTDRIASALSVLVGVRAVYADGRLETGFTGPPEQCPDGARPWFEDSSCDATVIFGHWAALGLHIGEKHVGLDTGCVWGDRLTAMRLSDRAIFHQPSLESRRAIG